MASSPDNEAQGLQQALDGTFAAMAEVLENTTATLEVREFGTVSRVGNAIVRVSGLPKVQAGELVRFPENRLGMVFDLEPNEVAVVMLDDSEQIEVGHQVRRTHRVFDVPVGEALVGRVVDAIGRPLDGRGPIGTAERRPIECEARAIMERAAVSVPLQTGLQVVDALIPIGRGQRELILGDRQTGKTAVVLDAIINQKDKNVLCIYCAIGQRTSAVAQVIADLRERGALTYCTVLVATGNDSAGLNFVAPYAATSIAEHFMEQGRDVLIVYDDLTHHARTYRELCLLLRRPPAREAYPGDIFYIHSRLLERSTHLREELGGGSLTALPIIETQAQNVSAYIPTNLISITDGQVYLSPRLFQEGILPAVDVGKSVSRVGGKTQLPAYRTVAGDLRLAYSQFEELEAFARFGTRLDEETQATLERGRRVREVLKQPQYEPIPAAEQVAVLLAVNQGCFDELDLEKLPEAKRLVRQKVTEQLPECCDRIQAGEKLSEQDQQALTDLAAQALESLKEPAGHADAGDAEKEA